MFATAGNPSKQKDHSTGQPRALTSRRPKCGIFDAPKAPEAPEPPKAPPFSGPDLPLTSPSWPLFPSLWGFARGLGLGAGCSFLLRPSTWNHNISEAMAQGSEGTDSPWTKNLPLIYTCQACHSQLDISIGPGQNFWLLRAPFPVSIAVAEQVLPKDVCFPFAIMALDGYVVCQGTE